MVFVESLTFAAVNSLHCAGMCGPLAGLFPGARSGILAYQGARVLSYTGVGAVAGGFGAAAGAGSLGQAGGFSLFLGALMLLFAAGVGQRMTLIPGLGASLGTVMRGSRRLPPFGRALVLGACTPLLPCGLLYAAVSAAVLAGSPTSGALSMFAFAIGSCPLLVLAQLQLGWLRARLGPAGLAKVSRATLGVAGAVLVWRGVSDLVAGTCCL